MPPIAPRTRRQRSISRIARRPSTRSGSAQPERAFRVVRAHARGASRRHARAATALIPLYEADEKWARLPALYELLIEHAEETDDKLCAPRKARANHRGTALAIARRRRRTRAARTRSRRTMRTSSRSSRRRSRAAGAWAIFVEAVEERAKKVKKKKRRPFELKLAEVYTRELSRVDDAVAIYKALLETDARTSRRVRRSKPSCVARAGATICDGCSVFVSDNRRPTTNA